MSAAARHWEQDKDSTLYVGNLAEEVTDAQVWELFLQCGPVVNVHLPKDRVSQNHQGFGFVEFSGEEDADYACKIMNQIRLYGKPIRVNKASADRRTNPDGTIASSTSVGAELFVGNLDAMVDERVLFDTFSRFGPLLAPPKVTRDDSNLSKGYGFVSYATFEASDDAIANMHGQYLMNKEVTVQYAFKKDGKGERHGDAAERALAAQAQKNGVEMQIPAMPAALSMQQQAMPVMPPGMPNGLGYGMPMQPPPMQYAVPGAQAYGYAAPSPVQPNGYAPPPRQFDNTPLQAPGAGAGLPARPPASNAGYGGPSGYPPGMAPGYPPGYGRPPGQ